MIDSAPSRQKRSSAAMAGLVCASLAAACAPSPGGDADSASTSDTPEMPETSADETSTDETSAAEASADETSADTASTPAPTPEDLSETALAYMERRAPVVEDTEPHPSAAANLASCVVCHGPAGGGIASLEAPRIGGMAEWYLARQLKYFKTGVRGGVAEEDPVGTRMHAFALTLETDRVIEDLAAHFASLSPPPAEPWSGAGDAERGRELYTVCMACHGEEGRANPELNTPSLVGQQPAYVLRQIENFRTGARGAHEWDLFGQQMVAITGAAVESRQDALDLTAYIDTLASRAREQ